MMTTAEERTRGHVARIAEHGYTVIEGVLDGAQCDALLADLDRLERDLEIRPAGNSFEGANTTRVYNLLAHGSMWESVPIGSKGSPGRRRRARCRVPRVIAVIGLDRTR